MFLTPYEIWTLNGNKGDFGAFCSELREQKRIMEQAQFFERIRSIGDLLLKIDWRNLPLMTKEGDFEYISIELMPQIMSIISKAMETGNLYKLEEWTNPDYSE